VVVMLYYEKVKDMEMVISGYTVLLDDEDYERLKGVGYYINSTQAKRDNLYYFNRPIYVSGKRTTTMLHRDVIGCVYGDGKTVDHKDGNTLDCRKENLRVSTQAENCRNQKKPKNNTSGVKGVSWHEQSSKWRAYINVDGKRIDLGLHTDIKDAEKAYAEGSKKYHGIFGRTK
jgi:hypothetical protein